MMPRGFKIAGKRFRNGFDQYDGSITYYTAIATDHLAEDRGVMQPFSSESRAAWASRVLQAHYPGRTYQTWRRVTPRGVDVTQMEALEAAAIDEVRRIELADKYGIDAA
ncbi:hypothetical protein D3C85_1037410 [compost metagenome]